VIDSLNACSCFICICNCMVWSFIVGMHVLVKFVLLPYVVYVLYYIVVDFKMLCTANDVMCFTFSAVLCCDALYYYILLCAVMSCAVQ
jgi:hypothetical protein